MIAKRLCNNMALSYVFLLQKSRKKMRLRKYRPSHAAVAKPTRYARRNINWTESSPTDRHADRQTGPNTDMS